MHALRCLGLVGLLAATAVVQAAPVTYTLDPDHTQVHFSWSHFGYSHPGANLGLGHGTLVFDEQHPERSSVQVSLPLSTLDTQVAALDMHLRQADFLDAAKYPQVTFHSTQVQPLGGNRFRVQGDLAIHGVTRSVTLEATLNRIGVHPMSQRQSIGFDATTQIRRAEFGVGADVPDVSDELTVRITTEGTVPAPAQK
jgi:polyisoprenoid-binding protein YceI